MLYTESMALASKKPAPFFLDILSITGADLDHSRDEERWITFGNSALNKFILVSHSDSGETVRVISARLGTKFERDLYEKS